MGDWADDWAGQTITIRPHISFRADQRIETAKIAVSTTIDNPGQAKKDQSVSTALDITPLETAIAIVEECVLSWTLLGHDSQPLPPNRHGVTSEQAPPDLLDVATSEIMEFYESRRPKLKARSKRNA